MTKFVVSVVDGIVALDPIVGHIRKVQTIHSGPTRNVAAITEHLCGTSFAKSPIAQAAD